MNIRVLREDVTKVKTPALIVNLFEGVKSPGGATGAVDKALDGAISQLIGEGEIKGNSREFTLIHTFGKIGPDRVLVAGLGKQEDFSANTVRVVSGNACRFLRNRSITSACTIAHGAGIGGLDPQSAAQAIAEGTLLGLYRFRQYLADNGDGKDLENLTIVEGNADKTAALETGLRVGRITAEGAMLARDMANEPANVMTPTRMSEVARQVADADGLEVDILDREQMEELGMGALLGVAQGSHQPPKLIILKYNGDPDNPSDNLGFIGKGITFDTGGISIKPAGGMERMKGDMSGGASVIGAMQVLARLRPKANVTGVVPAAENMPGGEAQRPGDIVRTMSGKTVEVINTDAEGRLVLADAMTYAKQLGVSRMVDIATLTGAIVISLGKVCSGVMGNDQKFIDQVIGAGDATGERIWQLPMFDEYKETLKSSVADMMNVGSNRDAGSITAAKFLSEFTDGVPWAHLDIAGTARSDSDKGHLVKGATGVPVRTLVNLALAEAS
ncbi:MAG: leucyl aminopeptidase [Chloroflexi bacterium]|nr:leucyl aminopeptidase [Chloroflexota bacterium]